MSRRRGFTLLETVLAVAVGSIVLAATLGVLTTVRQSNAALGEQSRDMNDLAQTQLAVRRAMDTLLAAPTGAVRGALAGSAEEAFIDAVLDTANPDPIPGLPARFEMTTGDNPRFEMVLSRPLLDRPPEPGAGSRFERRLGRTAADVGAALGVSASDLPGHRGAFELRRAQGEQHPDLWWVPLPPRPVTTAGGSPAPFDADTLPPPRRLCRDVTALRWTGFIDSERVPRVRAVESSQFPAFVELEIATAGGGYGNWTMELAWTVGAELNPPEVPDIGIDAEPADPTPEDEGEFVPDVIDFEDAVGQTGVRG
ncbi:MAG: type II secretion system protein [Planctomycetota bacterium]